jgi:hypothetical protein
VPLGLARARAAGAAHALRLHAAHGHHTGACCPCPRGAARSRRCLRHMCLCTLVDRQAPLHAPVLTGAWPAHHRRLRTSRPPASPPAVAAPLPRARARA